MKPIVSLWIQYTSLISATHWKILSVSGLTVSFHLTVNQALRRYMSLFPNGSCSEERLDLGLPREATVSTSVKCSHVKACEHHVWKQTQRNVEADKWCRETVAYKSTTAPKLDQTRCRIVQIRGEILNAWFFCCDHWCYGSEINHCHHWAQYFVVWCLSVMYLYFVVWCGVCQGNKRENCYSKHGA